MVTFNIFKRQRASNDSIYDLTERLQMSMIEDHLATPFFKASTLPATNDAPAAWLDANSLDIITDAAKQNMPYATAIAYSTPLYTHPPTVNF